MDTRTSPFRLRIERVARRAGTARPRRRAGAVERPAPVRIPARALAGPAVALGLHRLDGHAGRHADRAALFADSRYWVQAEAELAGSGIELVKIPTGTSTAPCRLAGRAAAGRRDASASTAACWAWPRRSAAGARSTRAGVALRTDFDVLADVWPERPGLPDAPRLRAPRAAGAAGARRQAGAGARGDGARTARRTTSSRPSTTSPGCSTCAAPTSASTRCSSPTR